MTRLLVRSVKALRLLQHPLYRRGLCRGVAAAIEHEAILRHLEARTVLDVGANKGQFSLVARRLFPGASIHAFEPLAEPARIFSRVFEGDGAVRLYCLALGPEGGEGEIYISRRNDSSSMLPVTRKQEVLRPGTRQTGARRVPLRRGDDVVDAARLDPPILIKLDVQGYEKAVLEGMPKLLSRADHVYAEIAFQELYRGQALASELIDFLGACGFGTASIVNRGSDRCGQPLDADALFTRHVP